MEIPNACVMLAIKAISNGLHSSFPIFLKNAKRKKEREREREREQSALNGAEGATAATNKQTPIAEAAIYGNWPTLILEKLISGKTPLNIFIYYSVCYLNLCIIMFK